MSNDPTPALTRQSVLRFGVISIAVVTAFFLIRYSLDASRPDPVAVRNDTDMVVELRDCNEGFLLRGKVNVPLGRSPDVHPKGPCDVFVDRKAYGCLQMPPESERKPKPVVLVSTMTKGDGCPD